MRILLISGIVFVHVPYDPQTSPFTGDNGFIDWFRVFLGDSLFRVGVPCLSAISGYLLFRRGIDAFDYGKTILSKLRTVLLPFLIWNLSFIVVVLVAQGNGIGFGYLPDAINATPRDWATLATALEAFPMNLPLYFLRDLLLCIVLSPLLAIMIKRAPIATLALIFIYVVFPVPSGIFLKKSILFGFCCGIYVSLHRIDVKTLDPYAGRIAAIFMTVSVILATLLYWNGPDYPVWVDVLRSLVALCGIIGSWAISLLLIRSKLGKRLSKLEGLSFWVFCAHYPLLIVFWMIWNRAGDADFYPLFYFSAPILALVILTVTHKATQVLAPPLHAILTGSRAGKVVQAKTISPPHDTAEKNWRDPYTAKKKVTR